MYYLRYIIPLLILGHLIRKNPFYRTYPIMLPVMIIAFFTVFMRFLKFSRSTNNMVQQILLDPTGTELTFVYSNQFLRRLRQDKTEVTLPIASLVNPPQGENYQELSGILFPDSFPPDWTVLGKQWNFFKKYYISQRTFFSFAIFQFYANFEILTHAFDSQIINLEKADIWEIDNHKMTTKEFNDFMYLNSLYNKDAWEKHYKQMRSLAIVEFDIMLD